MPRCARASASRSATPSGSATCPAFAGRLAVHVVEFSVQGNHVHMLVEAKDRQALSRGIQGLAIRLARAVNRVLARVGKVWADRYHRHDLASPIGRPARRPVHGYWMRGGSGLDLWESATCRGSFERSRPPLSDPPIW
ncbi:MAG TPA: transposase [Geminicoccaceae bacterium]|nr:transposase [Geminicoccaceae bacterium]